MVSGDEIDLESKARCIVRNHFRKDILISLEILDTILGTIGSHWRVLNSNIKCAELYFEDYLGCRVKTGLEKNKSGEYTINRMLRQ